MASRAQWTIEEIDRLVARERAITSPRGPAEHAMPFSPEPSKKRALCDASRALERIGAPYALIGGVAVGIHSDHPRATRDVDIAVASWMDRVRVREAMEAAGFEFRGDFEHTINFRHASSEPLQLVFGAEFDGAIARAERVDVDGDAIAIVTKADLIELKERSGADPRRRRSRALLDQSDVVLLRGDVPDEDEGW
jgi:hypothetical protein